ncbi:MAG: hypothetical protein QM779_15775 [Propionicimonas sp.]|uniref:DMP19 family protein n=1 Tax=Propionicimonas sp. TaxID=1955623 RepID=UPI003D115010
MSATGDSIGTEAHRSRLDAFGQDVLRGGFAQLLFNAYGEGLPELEETLAAVGADRARKYFVDAVRLALADLDGYFAFMSDWNAPAGEGLRDRLHVLSVEYLHGTPTLEDETLLWRLLSL